MTEEFPDRRAQLFGRDAHVEYLTNRARQSGITVVSAQPLMGKTWVLNEVARRLVEEGHFLVGYHESTAAERSHLLYAVSNLYRCWLADSSMRAQFISLWQRHKGDVVPKIGLMVGGLFEALSRQQVPGGEVASLVRTSFESLAEAQKDLLTGGLEIPPLPYDQAHSLTNLVATVSKCGVVLILDAWEKSPSFHSEYATLEAFLKHQDDWPTTHIFLGIRNPDLHPPSSSDNAYLRARNLCRLNPSAEMFELPSMDLNDPTSRTCIVSYVRGALTSAKQMSEENLLQMIQGYPGVLYFWMNKANRAAILTPDDLRREADNAHLLRYSDLAHLLSELTNDQRTLAVRLAFFPRLDADKWATFQILLLQDLANTAVSDLTDAGILADERFPTYGHDTRHAAARNWFIENKCPLIRRVAEGLIETLASNITGVNNDSWPYIESLAACFDAASQVNVDHVMGCLIAAALSAFGNMDGINDIKFDDIYPKALQHNAAFTPLIAIALLKRAYDKSEGGDVGGAVIDNTAVVKLLDAPVEYVALALYNRGIAKGKRDDVDGAIADYTDVVELPDAPVEYVALALYNRGIAKGKRDDHDGEIADYTAVVELSGASVKLVAQALFNRGAEKGERGDDEEAIVDYTAVVKLLDAPVEQVAQAFFNRGNIKARRGDVNGAIADFTAIVDLPDAPIERVVQAFFSRGYFKGQRGDYDGAVVDCTAVAELPHASIEQVAEALGRRGVIKLKRCDHDGAIADYTAVLGLPGVSDESAAKALYHRGIVKGQRGDNEGAMADYTAVIGLPNAPVELVALVRELLLGGQLPPEPG